MNCKLRCRIVIYHIDRLTVENGFENKVSRDDTLNDTLNDTLSDTLNKNEKVTVEEISVFTGISESTVKRLTNISQKA